MPIRCLAVKDVPTSLWGRPRGGILRSIAARVRALPGVTDVALSDFAPFSGKRMMISQPDNVGQHGLVSMSWPSARDISRRWTRDG
jgi:hypothetical protein